MEIYKERNFSEVFSDSFGFIRQNFKSILLSFLIIAGPFVFIRAFSASYILANSFGNIYGNSLGTFSIGSIISLIFGVLSYLIILGIVAEYYFIKAENPDADINYQDIIQRLKKDFGILFSTFLYTLLLSLLVGLAFGIVFFVFGMLLAGVPIVGAILMFFLVIGLFIIVPNLSFLVVALYMIRLKDRKSFSDALSIAYNLTMENYWQTWVVVFVAMLLVSVIIGVSSFILGILIAVQAFNTASVSTDSFSWVSIVGFFIEFVTQFIQMILIFITMLWAFSLYEKKFAVGMP